VNLYLVVALAILLHLAFAGSRVTLSLFAISLDASPFTVGVIGRPEERARNFSLLALGFSTSGFLGPTMAGFLIDGIGHRLTFLLLSGSALALAAGGYYARGPVVCRT